jgi:predicted metal-dependent phosphoesterase TrpH
MDPQFNKRADEFAKRHNLIGTVGSDSHSLGEVGTASLSLPQFNDTARLKEALTMAHQNIRLSPPWVHFYSRYAAWRKKFAA